MDVDSERELTLEHGIRATPTFVLLDDAGEVVRVGVGLVQAHEVVGFLRGGEDLLALGRDLTLVPDGYRGRSTCFLNVGYGPIDIESQSPANALRQSLPPRTPSTLGRGQWELRWTETFANLWNESPGRYRIDYGSLQSRVTLAHGLTDDVQIELEFSDVTRTNSALDPITDGFHSLLGLSDSGRENYPSFDNEVFFAGEGGDPDIRDRTSGSISRDVALTLTQNLTCGGEVLPAIAYSLTARYNAGGRDLLEGPSDWSFGGSLSAAKRFGERWYGYLGAGYVRHGFTRAAWLELEDEQLSILAAFEWDYAAYRALTFQWLWSEGVAVDYEPFDEASHEWYLGWKIESPLDRVWEFGIVENAIVEDNSPDFGLHFGVKQRW